MHAAKKARVDHIVSPAGNLATKKSPGHSTLKQFSKQQRFATGGTSMMVYNLICRKVQRFWPEEGGWFDAIITDYRPTTQEHCLTYEINTESETFEWVCCTSDTLIFLRTCHPMFANKFRVQL